MYASLISWARRAIDRSRRSGALGDGPSTVSLLDPRMDAVNAHAMVSILDKDGRFEQVNDLFLDTFGYDESEIIGARARILYIETAESTFDKIHSTLKSGRCWNGDQLLQRKDGTPVWTRSTIYPLFDSDGHHIKSMTVRTDITDNKKMRSELDMYAALDLFEDAMFMFTTDTLQITYMNRAAMAQWGGTKEDVIARVPMATNPRFDADRFRAAAAPLLAGEVSEVVYVTHAYDNPFEVTLRLTTTADGARRFVTVERDIAERLALEEAKNAFTATVSHELRSPLTSIKGGIGLVLSGAAGIMPDKARSLLEIAHRNADRLVLIVNDMLDLEKIGAGQMTFDMRPFSAATLIEETLSANEAYLQKYGVHVQTSGVDTSAAVTCDPDRMLQALGNLLTNAAKFSVQGGEVRLALDLSEDEVTFSVSDDGVGIPAEDQATIFERFTQAKSADRARTGGTGLGLSIVKAIVENHDGRIDMTSHEGQGTTFRLVLPRAQAMEIAQPQASAGA